MLIRAVMEKGFSQRTAAKAVDTIVRVWRDAILAKDQRIEMPVGYIRVKKTPEHIYKKRYATRKVCGKDVGRLVTWTIYNDLYRIIWRVPPEQWEQLVEGLNSKDPS
jgi:hypothetical protein